VRGDSGFGHAGHVWNPDLDQDPADVAATYLQHRMVLAAREQLGERAPAPRFAEALGLTASGPIKHVQRLVAGAASLGLPELLRWCHVFRVAPAELFRGGLGDLESYPSAYKTLVDLAAEPLPQFRRRLALDWTAVGLSLQSLLTEAIARTDSAFMTDEVARFCAVQALLAVGVRRELIRPYGRHGIYIVGAVEHSLQIAASIAEDDVGLRRAVDSVVDPGDVDVTVLTLGRVSEVRLDTYVPGLLQTGQGSTFEVPLESLEHVSSERLDTVSWRLEAVTGTSDLRTIILTRKRAQARPDSSI
jgi:hypothetical protein